IEGRVDVAVSALGTAAAQRAHASVPGGIRALALGALADDAFMAERMPGSRTAIARPAPGMAGVEAPTLVAGYDTFLASNAAVSDDDAYTITMTLVRDWEALQRDYPALRSLSARELFVPETP